MKLLPERPILFSPSLAATLGLEEAVLLGVLADMTTHMPENDPRRQHRNGFDWYQLPESKIRDALPFWQTDDIRRICHSLREKGVLLVGAQNYGSGADFKMAFNERTVPDNHQSASARPAPVPSIAAPQPPRLSQTGDDPVFSKRPMTANWQPDKDTLTQLAQHSIPASFALQYVPEFVTYWRQRGDTQHSWGAKFMQHVIRKWRDFQALQHQRSQESHLDRNWLPSEDAYEILVNRAGIHREFVDDAIPEFILYWQERGEKSGTWNTKFIQHVRLQWGKYRSTLGHALEPKPIADNWQPAMEVYEVLAMANINADFARKLVPEFVLYWRDNGQAQSSWNSRFLQYVKRQWAHHHAMTPAGANSRSTRDISLEEQVNDRSWAAGLS